MASWLLIAFAYRAHQYARHPVMQTMDVKRVEMGHICVLHVIWLKIWVYFV